MIARATGCVTRTLGGTLLAALPGARVGDGVRVRAARGEPLDGEVVEVERARVAIAPFGTVAGVGVGDLVTVTPEAHAFPFGSAALGRALDAAGRPLDGGALARRKRPRGAWCGALRPGERRAIDTLLWTGLRAIDGLLPLGRGARVGLFGAPGAGKTTLLETIAAGARSDAVVLALIGERGREAERWFARIGPRMTILCATSDRSAAERVRAAEVAMTHAQRLRESGMHVALIVDSLARYASALRERGIALGEPVGRGGFPVSVWTALARYLERAGNARSGSITLFATVLVEADGERDPLGEAARSLLDGHIVLSSELARAGHFPAVDVLASSSRTMPAVAAPAHARDAGCVRGALALLDETKEARAIGIAERRDAPFTKAVTAERAILAFLQQQQVSHPAQTLSALRSVAALLEAG